MSWTMWWAFLAAAIIISVTPGPGAVLSIASGLRYGYARTLGAIAGLQVALLIQLVIVALGLGVLLAASNTAFLVLKLVGAGYLIYLGVTKWRAPVEEVDEAGAIRGSKSSLFLQGLFVNLTNPKALIFMVALVPQFVVPSLPQVPQFLIIAATMVMTDLVVMSCYALLAGRCRKWLHNPRMIRAQNRLFGGLFVSAGALLAASSRT